MTTAAATYQGWATRETWLAYNWLTVTPRVYDLAAQVRDAAEMREFVTGLVLGDDPGASLATDLLTDALERIAWAELVAAIATELDG